MIHDLDFEWDGDKAELNLEKHGVSFEEASTIFKDFLSLTIHDPLHSTLEEDRFITVGVSDQDRLVVVVHCDRDERIRIISARQANKLEKNEYEEGYTTRRN